MVGWEEIKGPNFLSSEIIYLTNIQLLYTCCLMCLHYFGDFVPFVCSLLAFWYLMTNKSKKKKWWSSFSIIWVVVASIQKSEGQM
jgi:hypothetical protein